MELRKNIKAVKITMQGKEWVTLQLLLTCNDEMQQASIDDWVANTGFITTVKVNGGDFILLWFGWGSR